MELVLRHCTRRNSRSMSLVTRLACWSAVVFAGIAWQHACRYADVDLRSSTDTCTVTKQAPLVCIDIMRSPVCLSGQFTKAVAPAWLGKLLVQAGPVWTWLPLTIWVVLNVGTERHHHSLRFFSVLISCVAVFISLINAVRYTARLPAALNPSGFDPSGHTFVFGLLIVPLWSLMGILIDSVDPVSSSVFSRRLSRYCIGACRVLEVLIYYFSFLTATFFHSASEVLISWLAVVVGAVLSAIVSEHILQSPQKLGSICLGLLTIGSLLWTASLSVFLKLGILNSSVRFGTLLQHAAFDVFIVLAAAVTWAAIRSSRFPAASTS